MIKTRFKEGAASFYIIAFSTLILLTIAMSFAAIMISQVTRTSNSDLSQSAYDSAMAGVEDAKLAYYNYQDCLAEGSVADELDGDGTIDCQEIIYLVEQSDSCDTVGYVLGRIPDDGEEAGGEVVIQESEDRSNNMQQAYTCVKMQTTLDNYEASISASYPTRVINPKFDGISANSIGEVLISWYSAQNASDYGSTINSLITGTTSNNQLRLRQYRFDSKPLPPMIFFGLVQAGGSFNFSDFDITQGSETNRGLVYLAPTGDPEMAKKKGYDDSYLPSYNDSTKMNRLSKDALLASNDKMRKNVPYAVYCSNSGSDYFCSALIELPNAIGGTRSDDSFTFVVGTPYGQPTEFSLNFICKSSASCGNTIEITGADGTTTTSRKTTALKGVQVGVDSTGRANDLYRRVMARMDVSGSSNDPNSPSWSSIMGPLELFGTNSTSAGGSTSYVLQKDTAVTCEYDFNPTCTR